MTTNSSILYIYRGLPSSGKSTAASLKVPTGRDISTDDFFHEDRDRSKPYTFVLERIFDGSAHGWAQDRVRSLLSDGTGLPVAIANTNTQRWEFQAYLDICEELGCEYEVIDLFDGGLSDEQLFARNAHGVPLERFAIMRARYEHDWTVGNPIPPHLRK